MFDQAVSWKRCHGDVLKLYRSIRCRYWNVSFLGLLWMIETTESGQLVGQLCGAYMCKRMSSSWKYCDSSFPLYWYGTGWNGEVSGLALTKTCVSGGILSFRLVMRLQHNRESLFFLSIGISLLRMVIVPRSTLMEFTYILIKSHPRIRGWLTFLPMYMMVNQWDNYIELLYIIVPGKLDRTLL